MVLNCLGLKSLLLEGRGVVFQMRWTNLNPYFLRPHHLVEVPVACVFANDVAVAGIFVETSMPHPVSLLDLRSKTFFEELSTFPGPEVCICPKKFDFFAEILNLCLCWARAFA